MINKTRIDRPARIDGVDFAMMYAAHDAFTRHLELLVAAIENGAAGAPGPAARWALFTRQLHIHHTAEDDTLWPPLRAAVAAPEETAVLDAMEREHGQLDPQLDRIDAALAGTTPADAAGAIRELLAGLGAHMRHEESAALPLVAKYLGAEGWAAFGRGIRKTQGIRGAAVYLPWLLDGAPKETATAVLAVLPPPARVVYRCAWAPRYRRSVA